MTAKKMNERAFSKYFKAFGDPTRLRILHILASGELTVNEIVNKVGLTQPTISRHLSILREAGAVTDRREGQKVVYSLNKMEVKDCCSGFCNCLKIEIPKNPKKKQKK